MRYLGDRTNSNSDYCANKQEIRDRDPLSTSWSHRTVARRVDALSPGAPGPDDADARRLHGKGGRTRTERYTLGHVPEAMRLATSRFEEHVGASSVPTTAKGAQRVAQEVGTEAGRTVTDCKGACSPGRSAFQAEGHRFESCRACHSPHHSAAEFREPGVERFACRWGSMPEGHDCSVLTARAAACVNRRPR